MQALTEYRATLCPLCGNPKDVCQAAEAEGRWIGTPPTRCHVTTAALRAQDEYAKANNSGHTRALLWGARER